MLQTNEYGMIKRPRILVRAAQIVARNEDRSAIQRRVLQCTFLPKEGRCLNLLLEKEDALNTLRQSKDAEYEVQLHVNVLAALISELTFLRIT